MSEPEDESESEVSDRREAMAADAESLERAAAVRSDRRSGAPLVSKGPMAAESQRVELRRSCGLAYWKRGARDRRRTARAAYRA